MRIEIAVVNYEGELWFELNGLKFDTLDAIWELDRKEVHVVRNGNVIASGRVSESRGEPAFNPKDDHASVWFHGSALHAEDFVLDDHIVLDVPDEFDLVNELRKSCWFLGGMIATVPVDVKMPIGAMRDLMTPELVRTQQTAEAAQILRFRRGK